MPAPACAADDQDKPTDPTDKIVVHGRALEIIDVAQSGSQGTVGYVDFEDVPISRTGELIENVRATQDRRGNVR